jgi:hypothetical protein
MRENRTYGSEGGETGTTGLPYPYSEDRPFGTEQHTRSWRESPASFDPARRFASHTPVRLPLLSASFSTFPRKPAMFAARHLCGTVSPKGEVFQCCPPR